MGKILFKSILSTSTNTQPKSTQNTSINILFQKYLKYKYKILAAGVTTSKCINMYGNIVTIKFWLIVNEND